MLLIINQCLKIHILAFLVYHRLQNWVIFAAAFLLRIAIKSGRLHLKQKKLWPSDCGSNFPGKDSLIFQCQDGFIWFHSRFRRKLKQSAFFHGTLVEEFKQHLPKAITLWVSYQQCTAGALLGWDPSFRVIGAILGLAEGELATSGYGGVHPQGAQKLSPRSDQNLAPAISS